MQKWEVFVRSIGSMAGRTNPVRALRTNAISTKVYNTGQTPQCAPHSQGWTFRRVPLSPMRYEVLVRTRHIYVRTCVFHTRHHPLYVRLSPSFPSFLRTICRIVRVQYVRSTGGRTAYLFLRYLLVSIYLSIYHPSIIYSYLSIYLSIIHPSIHLILFYSRRTHARL